MGKWQSGRGQLALLLLSVVLAGCAQVPGVDKFLFATNADRDDALAAAGDVDAAGTDAASSDVNDVVSAELGNDSDAASDTMVDGDAGSDTTADGDAGSDTTVDGDGTDSDAPDATQCPGGARCPCTTFNDCDEFQCLDTMNGKQCAPSCSGSGSCLASESCATLTVESGPTDFCVPQWVSLCAPCGHDADCGFPGANGASCTGGGKGGFCTISCSGSADCPSGYDCTAKKCVPTSGTCACSAWAVSSGVIVPCKVANQFGTCGGVFKCAQVGAWPTCPAATPAIESCNNKDDNCDGKTDEGTALCSDGDACTLDSCSSGVCKHMAGSTCGDGVCASTCGETLASCPADCHSCGDGVCSPGESPANCAGDCCGTCGDGKCLGGTCGENSSTCAKDCGTLCGNGTCDAGENPGNCAADCAKQVCGNGVCETGESSGTCPKDCATTCGNCVCDKGESFTNCPSDCGFCGDGSCSPCGGLGETAATCPADCTTTTDPCAGAWQTYCNDNSPCTDDSCQTGVGCVHVPNNATCSDGNACTGGDHCSGGSCSGSTPVPCDDGKPCTADSCDPATGCVNLALSNTPCNDEDACTASDTCSAGTCAGEKIGCADKDPCTVDTCNSASGCVHTLDAKALCDDGNACTSDDSCATGTCAGLLRLWHTTISTDQDILAIAARPDGGLVTVSRSSKDLAVRAWSKDGVNQWTHTFSTGAARAGVAVAANGDVAVASSTGVDGAVNVYSSTGTVIATTVVPSKSTGELNAIVADAAGGFHAYGRLVTPADPNGDVWFVDLDAKGNVAAQISAGGPAMDALYTATVASDGSYLIAGIASKSTTSGPFILKISPGKSDPQNAVSWAYSYPSAGAGEFNQIVAASDGGAFAIGEVVANTGVAQVLTVRVDASGKPMWSHVDNAKSGGTGTGAAKLAGDRWMAASVASTLMNRSALGADGVTLWTMSPGTGGASKLATLLDGTVAIASVSSTGMQVQRVDAFGNADCASSGACLDKTLADCSDANACTSDECTAGACAHPGQFSGTPCSDGDPCHGDSVCASGSCGVGSDVLGFLMDTAFGAGTQIAALPGGAWVITTTTASGTGLAIVAYTATGTKKWSVTYSNLTAQTLFVDSSGNTLILGFDPSQMMGSIRRLALDGTETGNWTVKVGAGTALTFGGGADSSKDGYLLAAADATQGYLLQLSTDGQVYGTHNVAGWSQVHGPVIAADGNVFVSGSSVSAGASKPFVGKYTPWGDQVWRYDYASSGVAAMSSFTAPVLLPDGGCAVATASDQLRILHFSPDGVLTQMNAFATGAPPGIVLPTALAATSDGSLIVTTMQGSNALVWRIDPQGNLAGSLPLSVASLANSAMGVAVSAQDRVALTSGATSGATVLAMWRVDGFLNDSCKASGGCVAKSPAVCSQGNSCAIDACASGTCTHNNRPDGAACTDGTSCTYGDVCTSAVCKSGGPVLGSWSGVAQAGVAVVPWGDNSATVSQTNVGVYAVVTKRDPTGTVLWTQNSLSAHVAANSRPAIDMFGNLLVPGHDNTTDAAWLWQLDATGNAVGGGTGYTFGAWSSSEFRTVLSANGLVYAVGSTGKAGTGTNSDFWLVPLTSALGQSGTDWKFDTTGATFQSNSDVAMSAALASDGTVYIIGNSTPVGSSTSAMHLLKVDPMTGQVNWQFTNGAPGVSANYGYDVVATSDGGCFAVGSMPMGGGVQSVWVARFNSFGVQQWNRTVSDPGGKDAIGFGAAVLQDGSFAVAGQLSSVAHVWRFKSTGDALGDWALTGSTASRIAEATTGGLLIATTSGSPPTDSLVHTDSFGNLTCSGSGSCFDYTTKSCDDNNACTLDSCTGACTHTNVPDGQWCEDGKACTVNESCTAGVCTNSKPALWSVVDPSGATAVVSAGSNGSALVTAASSSGKFAIRSWDWSGASLGSVSPAGAYAGSGRMQVNGDGSYVVAGHTDSMTDTDPWIGKFSQSQQKMWIVASGQVGSPDKLDAVIPRNGGGYWGVGANIGANALEQCWIQAYGDADGAPGATASISPPGANVMCVNARTANDGSFFAVGTSMGTGPMKGFIAKLGADGSQKWNATAATAAGVNFYDVAPTFDGGAVAVGTSGSAKSDVAVVRFDATGIEMWARKLNYGGVNEGRSVNVRDDGSIDVAGSCNGLFCLMRLSPLASTQWQHTYGAGRALQILPLQYNGAVLVGESSVNQVIRIDWSGNATCTDSGTCITMNPTNCSSSMECSSAICAAGQCNWTQIADATPCEDGNPCTGGDTCSFGKCNTGASGACGDGICSCGENTTTCPADCPPVCGNGICEAGEALTCLKDCP